MQLNLDCIWAIWKHAGELSGSALADRILQVENKLLMQSLSLGFLTGIACCKEATRINEVDAVPAVQFELTHLTQLTLVRMTRENEMLSASIGRYISTLLRHFEALAKSVLTGTDAGSEAAFLESLHGLTQHDVAEQIGIVYGSNLLSYMRSLNGILRSLDARAAVLKRQDSTPMSWSTMVESESSVDEGRLQSAVSIRDQLMVVQSRVLHFLSTCVAVYITNSSSQKDWLEYVLQRDINLQAVPSTEASEIESTLSSLELDSQYDEVQSINLALYLGTLSGEQAKTRKFVEFYGKQLTHFYSADHDTLELIITGLSFIAARSIENEQHAIPLIKRIIDVAPGTYDHADERNPVVQLGASCLCDLFANYSSDSIMSVVFQYLKNIGPSSSVVDSVV